MSVVLLAVLAAAVLAVLAAPKSKLEAWWQASTAHFLYQEARKQLDAAQAQPTPQAAARPGRAGQLKSNP